MPSRAFQARCRRQPRDPAIDSGSAVARQATPAGSAGEPLSPASRQRGSPQAALQEALQDAAAPWQDAAVVSESTFPLDRQPGVSAARVHLVARVDGREVGRHVLSREAAEVEVGSGAEAGLRVTHRSVSRRHVRLALKALGVQATDLGSTNGTLYMGTRIGEAFVPFGASLLLGEVELQLLPERDEARWRFGALETASPAMGAAYDTLARAAKSDVTVLLEAETGCGKDVCARTLHQESPRVAGAFEAVDCGALPRELAAAELFGHEKGAFTGAVRANAGAFERAGGGTLFLDEVGELSLELQPLLLRALETRTVRRVGGEKYLPVDVRVVAATNRDLDVEVKAGRFRSDLLHRLSVVRVRLPRLAERPEDLPLLVRRILDELGPRAVGMSLSPDTLARLRAQPWPGNVRELRNFLERAVTLGAGTPSVAPAGSAEAAAAFSDDYRQAREQALDAFERDFASHLLRRFNGNVTRAAKEAGIGRAYLHKLIKRHGLDGQGRG